MRLIDGDALIAWIKESQHMTSKMRNIICKVETMPSADRPQGEWVEQEDDYYHYWECSECGMGVGLDDIRNYCPNCGADMREGE